MFVGKAFISATGKLYHYLIVLFTKEYFPNNSSEECVRGACCRGDPEAAVRGRPGRGRAAIGAHLRRGMHGCPEAGVVDFRAVAPVLGTADDMERLLRRAREFW